MLGDRRWEFQRTLVTTGDRRLLWLSDVFENGTPEESPDSSGKVVVFAYCCTGVSWLLDSTVCRPALRPLLVGITATGLVSWKFSTVSEGRTICCPFVAAETPVPAAPPTAAPIAAPLPPPARAPISAPIPAPAPTLVAVLLPRELPALLNWLVCRS